jgi:tripartite ATP-independent transporter DctM subunit|nr:TRAP transporter large permease [Kofleriaceae bacterium]
MPPRKMVGLAITAALLALLAYYVSIPVALLALAFISGSPLFSIMLAATALGAFYLDGTSHRGFDSEYNGMVEHILDVGLGDQVQVMSTIPMFIFVGYILAEAKTADRLVRFANAMLGWAPGGLAIVTICTCALFTVFTGASGVTIIALGGVLMPALVRNGYPERFSMGLIAGTGSVGLLFPPALPLFIYGTVYGLTQLDKENWDTMRFAFAGIVPGMVLVGMLSAVAVTVAIMKKLPRQKFDLGELGKSFLRALPELAIPFGVIIGLAKGFGLPEIASLTVVYVVVLEVFALKMITFKMMWTTSREAMAMVGAILIIIFASTALTNFMVTADVPPKLVAWTVEHVDSKIVFLLAINVILLIVGTVMDIFSAIVVVLPLIAPIAKKYGVDPYHLGVIFLLNLEVGYLHPPVGLNLFITSIKFQRPITEVMWATIPFLITMILALLTITYVPAITAVSVPDPPRTGRIADLEAPVRAHVEELTATKEVALVAFDGTPLKDATGKPIIVKAEECDKLDEKAKIGCQAVFFTKKRCSTDPKPDDCSHKLIAKWAKENRAPVTVTEIALVDDDHKPVVKDGKPVVKKYADCGDDDDCKELFKQVSGCNIDPEGRTVDQCAFDIISKYVRESQ